MFKKYIFLGVLLVSTQMHATDHACPVKILHEPLIKFFEKYDVLKCPITRPFLGIALVTASAILIEEMLRDLWFPYLHLKQHAKNTEKVIEQGDRNHILTEQEVKNLGILQAVSRAYRHLSREWFATLGASYLAYLGIKLLRV
ncbi:MAG: hypothetical protein WA432_02365 [Candidatus Babeliaceae bacterium]